MMENMDDINNLMDNFDVKTFWQKRKLSQIFGMYIGYVGVGTIMLIKAVLDASAAGAVPKGMDVTKDAKRSVVR